MKLYIGRNAFNTRDQTMEYIGEAKDRLELGRMQNQYIENIKFKSYYQRVIFDKDEDENLMLIVDFGSYTRFFYVYDLDDELTDLWNKMNKGKNE